MHRSYNENDKPQILRLNQQFVQDLSPMDGKRFEELRSMCTYLRVVDHGDLVAGFIMGFTPGSSYDSPNSDGFAKTSTVFFISTG